MLELIFQGFVEWGYGLTLEVWEYFSSALLDLMSMDFAYLKTHVPVLDEIMQLMLAVGWALLIGNLVFQAVKSMVTGLGFEGEDPKLLFTRTFVFSFLLLASPQICEIGLDMTSTVITMLDVPDAVNITFPDSATFGGLAAAWILVVITGFILMFKVFRLLIEIAERYIILAILTICAPLAFGVGGSKNTSDIFTGWCRMFGSMCFVMCTNVIFFKMLLSVLSYVPSGLDVLPWMVLVFGIVKVAKKIDAIITRIGLNPAITGDGLGGRSLPGMLTYMVMRQVVSNVAKSAGKSAGGAKGAKGASPKTPPPAGGGPRTGPTAGGARPTGTAGTGSQNSSQQTNQQNSASQTSTAQSRSAHGGDTTQFGAQQSSTDQHNAGAAFAGGVNQQSQKNAAYRNNSTRRSAVPPGTRRAASHVQGSALSGTAGTGRTANSETNQGTTGMRSGTAGTATPGAAGRPGAGAKGASGTAGTGTGFQTRFTNASNQSVNEGGATSRVNATEQNNINVGASTQARQGSSVPTGKPQSPSAPGQNAQGGAPVSTRFTNREPGKTRGSAPPPQGTATVQSAKQPASPAAPAAQPKGSAPSGDVRQPAAEGRHGRNAAPVNAGAAASERRPSPARQEQASAGAASPTKGAAPNPRPGMAGTAPKADQAAQARQTARNQASASRSTPTATGVSGGKMASSTTTAQQEKAGANTRRSTRKKGGGDGR